MNRADVIRLAREAGFRTGTYDAAAVPFASTIGDNCLVEVERLIELAQAEVRKEIEVAVADLDCAHRCGIGGEILRAIRARTQPAPTTKDQPCSE